MSFILKVVWSKFFGSAIGFGATSYHAVIKRFCKLFACLVASRGLLFSNAFLSELSRKIFELLFIIFLLNLRLGL